MILQVLGKRWKLRFVPHLHPYGECDSPDTKAKEIRIRASLRGEEKLDAIVHEMIHAAGWHIDEYFVNQLATDIARTLWRLGYRDSRELLNLGG